MARTSVHELKGTPLALIEAAERLFGQYGIDSVSMRQIRLEADVGNNSAIAYHFSDRAALIRAIWEYRLPPLDRARRALLDRIYEQGLQQDPDAVIRALVIPNYELKDASGAHRYAAFFRHAFRWEHGIDMRNEKLHETPATIEALDLFYALQPDVDPALLRYRFRYGSCMFFDMIVDRDIAVAAGEEVLPEQTFLAEGIAMLRAVSLRPDA